MHEIELKFVLDEQGEKRLRESPALCRLAAGKAASESLHTVYYDTADRALRDAGIALRLRRKGRRWVQTVKAGKSLRSGLSSATEAECALPEGRLDLERVPDEAIRETVLRHLNGHAPEPVCETHIRRTRRDLALPDRSRIELAIDVGEIRAGDRALPWREAELELKAGAPAALFEAARALFPEGGLEFSGLTKSERGYLLAEQGRIAPPPEPRKARPVPLDRGQATEEAMLAILRECLDQVQANMLAVARGDDPEGPHQLRVGLRRLRAAFAAFRRATGRAPLRALEEEARWLGQEVGRLRDLDVVLGEILAPEARRHPDDEGFRLLAEALARAAGEERARLRETLKGRRAHAFLLDLAAFVEARGWVRPDDPKRARALKRPVAGQAGAALDRAWKRARARAQKPGEKAPAIEALTIEERHDLRKALKRLRYAVEFFAPLYAEGEVRPFLKRLKELQELFGDLNDAALAEAMLAGPGSPAAGEPAAGRAAELVVDARREGAERAWEQARAAWAALRDAPRFWKEDRCAS